ncbi:MAG: hypothetical protein KF861_10975 [Planctomycetaceae bacterium]|nr:hypothetical protein [Planctomycetaceae bacterium]
MRGLRRLLMIAAVLAGTVFTAHQAHAAYRQYYSSWNYYPSRSYYYRTYYYKPYNNYTSYNYHYCVYYPSRPRYVYYYNPHRGYYWGRFDLEGKDGAQYSILKEEDRKSQLTDIPESAFPEPAAMPAIPDSEDGEKVAVPEGVPTQDTPAGEPTTPPAN